MVQTRIKNTDENVDVICLSEKKRSFDEVEKEHKLESNRPGKKLATLLITCMALSRGLYLSEPLLSS